jgi:hypothetical protein
MMAAVSFSLCALEVKKLRSIVLTKSTLSIEMIEFDFYVNIRNQGIKYERRLKFS